MPKVYVIIPVYKTERFLRRCVDSVLAQTYREVIAVLIDDGSPDGSPAICDEYAARYENVHVIHQKNGGLSAARNAGIEYALSHGDPSADHLTFLDSDDFLLPRFCERMTDIAARFDAATVQCEYEKGAGENVTAGTTDEPKLVSGSAEEMLLDQAMKSLSCGKLYRLGSFDGVRYPLGVLNEDEYTTYRLIYAGKTAARTDEKLYYYYINDSGIMSQIASKLKNNPHLYDWLAAYRQRIAFFEAEKKPEQVMRTHEKICTDVILRYCEQSYLPLDERDEAFTSGTYLRLYRESYPKMIRRKGISFTRRCMYIAFRVLPVSGVLMGKLFGLRK